MKQIRLSHYLLFSLLFLFLAPAMINAQDYFVNMYSRKNNDNTLKLAFIEHDSENTTVYVQYLGNTNVGTYTGLYLNNFRIMDRETGDEYKPVETGFLPTTIDGKFVVYNGETILYLPIAFKRLPSRVKNIDLVEGEGSAGATYSFTFRNIRIDRSVNVEDEFMEEMFTMPTPYAATIYSYFNATIDLYVRGTLLAKLDRYFKDKNTKPNCGQFGTVTILTPRNEPIPMLGMAEKDGKKLSWDFKVTPLDASFGECKKFSLSGSK